MAAQASHNTRTDPGDTGVEILPGVVSVDLTIANVNALTVADLREAMNEAEAQANESELEAEDVLGGLDTNPL